MNRSSAPSMIHLENPFIEEILEMNREALANDFEAYKNHVFRVFNMAQLLASATGVNLSKLAIGAAFHDLGIWTANTWDYIEPSIKLAAKFLAEKKKKDWVFEVTFIISEHHKLSRCRGEFTHLPNAFRAADWMDVMFFFIPSRLPKSYLKELLEAFPRAGFHKRLWQIGSQWAWQHPFNPLPMFKL